MTKRIITAKVLAHNIVGDLASYKVKALSMRDEQGIQMTLDQELYFEVIIRKSPMQHGGIEEREALKILDGDTIKIETEPSTWGPDGAFEILDMRLEGDRPFHRRNLLVMKS